MTPVRLGRRLARLLAALALALGLVVLAAPSAHAASADQIDSYAMVFTLKPSGLLHVQETIDYRFGDSSGRHGIQRDLVTREKYDDDNDAAYDVSNIDVSSPDGVATEFTTKTSETDGGRNTFLNIRIGDPNQTVSAATATYVISYDVSGSMRTFAGYDELFWDAPGFGWDAGISDLSVKATVPGGAEETSCFYGAPGSKTVCPTNKATAGVAQFAVPSLPANQSLSFGVKIASGLVTDNKPHLEPDASALSGTAKAGLAVGGVGGAALLVGSPLVGLAWWRRNGRDQRYAGLPPGVVPLPGQPFTVVPHDPDLPIPVAFTPPRIPVAEAGLLADGQVDTRETAATIVDLAVRGALRVESQGDDDFRVTLLDPTRAGAPHEMVLLNELFNGAPPGAMKDLSNRGSMTEAHRAMQTSVISQVAARGWFRKVPPARAAGGIGLGAVAFIVFFAFQISHWLLLVLVPLLPVVITVSVIRRKLRRGQRTPDGRAVCDQIEGFRTYLATAEAEQLRFEEGEDIFSRYLPWAIIFELADRWADICQQLVAMGRLPDTTPYWYAGSYQMGFFNTAFLTSSLTTAATPAPSTSGGSGTGFGGGSSFGGGGFSGGGGGGGGGGSW
ncbi:DUF2207 domain-containing protein [uncultured Friedmanniella sp.]|uniref:DUF2207 domain-containing protein n=1 Tax=uncultured Friedmanniella sp. TaxID=335381 RepID=UPI0035CB9C8A